MELIESHWTLYYQIYLTSRLLVISRLFFSLHLLSTAIVSFKNYWSIYKFCRFWLHQLSV